MNYLKQSVRNGQGAQIVRSLRQIGQRSEGCEMSFQVGKAFHLKLYRIVPHYCQKTDELGSQCSASRFSESVQLAFAVQAKP